MQYRSMLSGRRVDAGEVLMGRMITMVAALMVLAGCRGDDGEVGDTNEDDDRDGYTEAEGDCDDGDPAVNPGSIDSWYDGIDSDCDGADDYDADGDVDLFVNAYRLRANQLFRNKGDGTVEESAFAAGVAGTAPLLGPARPDAAG